MTTSKEYNNFNNLTFVSKQIAIGERLEQLAGHTPIDLSFKKPSPTIEILTSGVSKINGKYADLKYIPDVVKSKPYLNYDAGYDPNKCCQEFICGCFWVLNTI